MIQNCLTSAWKCQGQTVNKWGKDRTGLITYQINNQGFRSADDYVDSPSYAFFGNSFIFGVGVPVTETLSSHFDLSQNYGLAGWYMNHHSVTNLTQFVNSDLFTSNTRIIFGWAKRTESIEQMVQQVDQMVPNVIHIRFDKTYSGAITSDPAVDLGPKIDNDVSGTHPGPKTYQLWAKKIKSLIERSKV